MASRLCGGDESGVCEEQAVCLFPTQIIVTRELDDISHIWLGSLSERMEKEKLVRLIESTEKLTGKAEKEFADSVFGSKHWSKRAGHRRIDGRW